MISSRAGFCLFYKRLEAGCFAELGADEVSARELERAAHEPQPEPEPERHPSPEPLEAAHLLFVRNGSGYRLVEREGPAPGVGSPIELDRLFAVTKLGRSPLPGDRRRCAYLELR